MITLPQQKALEISNLYQTNDPYKIAELENLDVLEENLSGRLKELYFGDCIILNKKMSFAKKRHYLAHALGHHYLHTGNYLFFSSMRYLQNFKEESQAEEFSAYLLIPNSQLDQILHWHISELADYFQVSPNFIKYRLNLLKPDSQNSFE